MATSTTRAAIVIGGGIGGFSAAIALRQRGIAATVYERAEALGDVGAGLLLAANAMRSLGRLGLAEATIAAGSFVTRAQIRAAAGSVLTETDMGNFAARWRASPAQAACLRSVAGRERRSAPPGPVVSASMRPDEPGIVLGGLQEAFERAERGDAAAREALFVAALRRAPSARPQLTSRAPAARSPGIRPRSCTRPTSALARRDGLAVSRREPVPGLRGARHARTRHRRDALPATPRSAAARSVLRAGRSEAMRRLGRLARRGRAPATTPSRTSRASSRRSPSSSISPSSAASPSRRSRRCVASPSAPCSATGRRRGSSSTARSTAT
jgi:hypothetical protein